MPSDAAALALLREQVVVLCVGTAFVVIGVAAWVIALARRRSGARVFVWLGAWSALYGLQDLARVPPAVAALPRAVRLLVPVLDVAISYLLVVIATMAYLQLSRGALRRLLRLEVVAGLAIAAAGVGTFVAGGRADAFILPNNLLAVLALLVLLTVIALPDRLSQRYLALPHRGVLLAGTLLFVAQGLYANLARPLRLPSSAVFDWLGFAVLLLSFGYVALRAVDANERRLLAIENELDVARRLQRSILPTAVPQLGRLRIAASYEPMTSVAGDFYEFLPVDAHRCGVLVADVSGHGVPAAPVASMIKVAVRSVAASAHDPSAFLARLGRTLLRRRPPAARSLARGRRIRTAGREQRPALRSGSGAGVPRPRDRLLRRRPLRPLHRRAERGGERGRRGLRRLAPGRGPARVPGSAGRVAVRPPARGAVRVAPGLGRAAGRHHVRRRRRGVSSAGTRDGHPGNRSRLAVV